MIILKGISFSYPKTKYNILNNININFEKGLVNVLIGLNGAGKTTLFDILIGQYKPLSGEIYNMPLPEEALYHVQGAYISFLVKGKDYIRLIYSISNKKFSSNPEHLMKDITLIDEREKRLFLDLWDKRIGQMSVGERRWLYITILSQIKKKLYIFDEPTAGVDPSSRIKIYKRLEKLSTSSDATLILATHHLHELKEINCKIILLHKGEVKFQGNFGEFISISGKSNPDEAFDQLIN
ncbi:ATP-binding cassette domain-containing protein [Paenibacillus polymyxa]|uniref:ATP-binding cassette domain-containing protein n=1 Tax=Paenibacillus polymyxa TaxID=1406 RepID=UPI0023791BD1|nr:ATP-binding cassette domain-containing protein [Paenibacillus polymyxa]WDM20583.1 ATP-binding cassette domain-containing protein [Paenibacillus polymyxa]